VNIFEFLLDLNWFTLTIDDLKESNGEILIWFGLRIGLCGVKVVVILS